LQRRRGSATNAAVRATRFEFEKRFWIICAIYLTGFCLSAFDHVPFIVALRHLIAPSIAPLSDVKVDPVARGVGRCNASAAGSRKR
jgi:hypothetical protein